ncbi:sulfatase [Verrucomicrobium sp. BvORR106]|uniref:sulfatase family protein n=1 Tax=Verrucomicrobium sp. BvORR106 TaxID=1403819 RepID=UPI00068B8B26|nr:sulfatase [Verrucomicrobium sp. BvORR106]
MNRSRPFRPSLLVPLLALLALLALWALQPRAYAAEPQKLNLLIITADDMNADSPGWMGNTVIKTPNLDAFAATGHRFINHHVTAPICQPSRSALMTGRVPHRNGALGFNPVREDVPTLVEILQQQGYFAACINKVVHMAPRTKFPWNSVADGSGKNPDQIGKDLATALQEASKTGKPFFINANITDPHRPFYGTTKAGGGKKRQAAKNPKTAGTDAEGDTDKDEAIITPIQPEAAQVPSFLEDVPDVRKEVAQYDSSVLRLDQSFSRILAALKDSGQEDRTVVVFLSDHGMSFPFSKATVYRNGTWSPVILRLPSNHPLTKPAVHEEFVSSVDLLPTLLELLSVPLPEGLDGRTWTPLLRGESQPNREAVVTHVNTVSSGQSFPQRCIRTKSRSLIFSAWSGGPRDFKVEAMSGLSFRALAEAAKSDPKIEARVTQLLKGIPLALYDLDKDPNERVNVIADPAYRNDAVKLVEQLKEHMTRSTDPQLDGFLHAAQPLQIADK